MGQAFLTRDDLKECTGLTFPITVEGIQVDSNRNSRVLTAVFTNGTKARIWPQAATNGRSCDGALKEFAATGKIRQLVVA